ncbi:MAG: NCS2 family permease [bacterium]
MSAIAKFFDFEQNETTLKQETIAGVTTFATMAYIIFVNPAILSTTGMDFGAVMVATCLAAAIGTLLMGLLANYPIALAPGMGLNAYFAFSVCGALQIPGQTAFGGVFLSGFAFIVLSFFKFREKIIASIPASLKHAIAVGIGLFIAFIGLKEGGVLMADPATFVKLGNLRSLVPLLTMFGLIMTAVLLVRRVSGAILWGILATGVLAGLSGMLEYKAIFDLPPSLAPTFAQLDIIGALQTGFLTIVIVFFFVDLFDTVGTIIAIGERGNFMRDGQLPRAGRALLSDALATAAGSLFGTSTTTSYIESTAGISEGARTGFANMITALLFLSAIFFAPLVKLLGDGIEVDGVHFHPITAPALIVVGSMMVVNSLKIDWQDYSESIPAFLTMLGIPLTFSIADGMALGFISYPLIKLFSGKGKEVGVAVYILGVVFMARYLLL